MGGRRVTDFLGETGTQTSKFLAAVPLFLPQLEIEILARTAQRGAAYSFPAPYRVAVTRYAPLLTDRELCAARALIHDYCSPEAVQTGLPPARRTSAQKVRTRVLKKYGR